MQVFINKIVVSVLVLMSLISFSYAGIQDCLDVYQEKSKEYADRTNNDNQEVDVISYTSPISPKNFPKMRSPAYYFRASTDATLSFEETNRAQAYCVGSICTFGVLLAGHVVSIGSYEVSKYAISGIANVTVIPALNAKKRIEKEVKTRNGADLYQQEIRLVEDLIHLNEDEIISSRPFMKLASLKRIQNYYPDLKDLYSVLKSAFDKQIYCSRDSNRWPIFLDKITKDLELGYLGEPQIHGIDL